MVKELANKRRDLQAPVSNSATVSLSFTRWKKSLPLSSLSSVRTTGFSKPPPRMTISAGNEPQAIGPPTKAIAKHRKSFNGP